MFSASVLQNYYEILVTMSQSPGQVVGVTTFLAVLALVAIVLRFCARRLKKVGLGWDDYSIVLAMVCWLLRSCES